MDLARHNFEEFRIHCTMFFDFRAYLDSEELAYLHYCFGDNRDSRDVADISSKTYGHRITKEGINSSRIGYGFAQLTQAHKKRIAQLLTHKLPCLDFSSILDTCDGAGIAWDVLRGHFKVYFYFKSYAGDVIPISIENQFSYLSSERIISHTYHNRQKIEEKYYYYPERSNWVELVAKYSAELPDTKLSIYAKRLAFVVSTTKKPRFQWDVNHAHTEDILDVLGDRAKELNSRCAALHQILDTVSLDSESIQLYFT